ncbi:HNH endonuclease [Paenibacillus sp. S3N08]|uniref:HNH endonuclease n=1 Tax=Paenibacillus agricola TaxID=2716264 RepID=A0ABX0J4S9_9BACL|nr:HNH endonuclease [Paenibacillus agricola]
MTVTERECRSCHGKSPEVNFSAHHKTCNKCRNSNNRAYLSEYGRNRRANQTDTDREKHRLRTRSDREANPQLTFLSTSQYLAKKAGVFSDLTKEDALDIYETPNTCAYCGKVCDPTAKRAIHIDHIVPMSQGGHNSRWNLIKVCISCNTSKSGQSLRHFYAITESFTEERYLAVISGMVERSHRSATEIDAILTQSHEFEASFNRERERLMALLSG